MLTFYNLTVGVCEMIPTSKERSGISQRLQGSKEALETIVLLVVLEVL